jgi:hypothetical protein|tara:strand:- start:1185 stop:1412 length:228 start_codon:yes stop_codon:yes gene_type:complete
MSLVKGDLVRVPANTCLTKRVNELAIIDAYTYLEKPTLGIFIRYTLDHNALVFINQKYWSVELKNLRYAGVVNAS